MDSSVSTTSTNSHLVSTLDTTVISSNPSTSTVSSSNETTTTTTNLPASFKAPLPPRKRAKTKEEKEQRRVERILRNRRAAHASREKKRKHVEYLEAYVVELEANLLKIEENFNAVSKLVDQSQLKSVSLQELKDLSELKEKIHSNLSGSRKSSSSNSQNNHDDDYDDDIEEDEQQETSPNKKRRIKSEPVEEKPLSDFQEKLKHIKQEPNDYLVPPPQEPCNYLSPISINSPINSPIDLTMRSSSLQSESPLLTSSSTSIPTTPSSSISSPKHSISLTNIQNSYELGQNSAVILSHGKAAIAI